MIGFSILFKVYALWLISHQPAAAVVLWLGSGELDWLWLWQAKGSESHESTGTCSGLSLWGWVVGIQIAAGLLGWTAYEWIQWLSLRWKDGSPIFAELIGLLCHGIGIPVAVGSGSLFLSTMSGPLQFRASLDQLGLGVPVLLFAVSTVYMLMGREPLGRVLRRLGLLALFLFLVTVVRYVLSTSFFLAVCDFVDYESEELPISPFYREPVIWGSFLVLLLLTLPVWNRIVSWGQAVLSPGASPGTQPWRKGATGRIILWFCVFGLLFLGMQWEPRGQRKPGRVLIHLYHTYWSRTDRPYDENWYGADSGYNYACLKAWLEHFYNVREWNRPLTPEVLAQTDVLIIFLPSTPFSEEELRAIQEFVRHGGGILLIGDHTNVFGSTSNINPICRMFGFAFRDDVLFDLDRDFFQLWERPFLQNTIMQGIPFFKFRGPTSIRPFSWFVRTVMKIGHSKGFRAIYSVNNFYPPPKDRPRMWTGTFAVSVTTHYGRGRVLAFADSTVFSNFEIFYPGKYEYLLNAVEWLNHSDGPWTVFLQRSCLVLALALLIAFLGWYRHPRQWLVLLVAAAGTFQIATLATRWIEDQRGRFPQPIRPTRLLFFVVDQDDPAFVLREFTSNEPYEKRFDVFVQWVLRTGTFSGFYPVGGKEGSPLYKALSRMKNTTCALGAILRSTNEWAQIQSVFLNPNLPRDHLFFLFSRSLPWPWIQKRLQELKIVRSSEDWARIAKAWPEGSVVLSSGSHRTVLVFNAERFSDRYMGFSEKVIPTPTQRALFDQEFRLIDRLFGIPPGGISPGRTNTVISSIPIRPGAWRSPSLLRSSIYQMATNLLNSTNSSQGNP